MDSAANIDGLVVRYQRLGSGAPHLLLLHGFGASIFTWRDVAPRLAGHGTVTAFDLPIFGHNPLPAFDRWPGPDPFTFDGAVDMTVEIARGLGIDRAVVIGHSAGGNLALGMARDHPEFVDALVLISSPVTGGPPSAVRRLAAQGWTAPLAQWSLGLAGKHLMKTGLARSRHDSEGVDDAVTRGYAQALQEPGWAGTLWRLTARFEAPDFATVVPSVRVPVLAIRGRDDRLLRREQTAALVANLPDSRNVVIEQCGHLPHEEHLERVVEEIVSFLDGIKPQARQP
jgi:pimeloyl-ACP methyl ester carboxylesterase